MLQILCDNCNKVAKINRFDEVPSGWYKLNCGHAQGLVTLNHICSTACLLKWTSRYGEETASIVSTADAIYSRFCELMKEYDDIILHRPTRVDVCWRLARAEVK